MSYPITEVDAKPVSDGAYAVLFATEEKVRKWTDKPIGVEGMGNCHDSQFLVDRDFAESPALASAAQTAYGMAGKNIPHREFLVGSPQNRNPPNPYAYAFRERQRGEKTRGRFHGWL